VSNTMHTLVEKYMPLANKLAFLQKKTLPNYIDVEELKSAAYLGLVEAASRYKESKGVSFTTFAYPRIFGAIKDYLRSLGPTLTSLDDNGDDETSLKDMIVAREERDDFEETLEVVAKDLGTQARSMLRFYFVDELSMKEVGERFGVSESRVSQLLSGYKTNIREKWTADTLREELAA
jgi:RNA polymerase sigma factor (sigma-70 family)